MKLKKVLLLFYHFAWTFFVVLLLPFLPFIRGGRLIERLGLRFPAVPPMKRPIWIHALSMGEVLSSLPLVRALRSAYPDRDIVYSVTTPQGMKIARQELKREVQFFFTMPLDFWWAVRRVVGAIRPCFFILVETDLWPGLLHHLKKRGVAALLVNGRISPRTLDAYLKCKYFVRMMLDCFEFCLMQSDLDRERVLKLGVEVGRVITAGNIKFDRERAPMRSEEHRTWMDALHLKPGEPLWVAGSTHEGEEEILLDALLDLRAAFPGMRLIIAPRKIERAEFIRNLGNQRGFKTRLKTGLAGSGGGYDVLILDTIGELGRIYGIARISFVGGSL
ncbi:MAG: glycosyltransferase N-terminal domain-containing protein, partial [Pseudomonadota bacterium]